MQLKKLLSYIYPVRVKTVSSERSNALEVTLVNGNLVLDSKNTNYSYGSLQKVLHKGLDYIGVETLRNCERMLLLGVAGGSVIQTLRHDFKCNAIIDAVEIDSNVIDLSKEYFNLDAYNDVNIIIDDAEKYVVTSNKSYDLIIVDIFNDNTMPDFLFKEGFWKNIYKILKNNSLCIFNSMISLRDIDQKNNLLKTHLEQLFSDVSHIIANQKHNKLFILKK